MKNIFLLFICTVSFCTGLQAQQPAVSNAWEIKGGLRFQKAQKLYWENGLTLDYSAAKLANRKVHLGVSYVTTRLGSAINSNAIKQDNFLVSGAYHFRYKKSLQPFVRLNTGYFHADYEKAIFDDLPNSAVLLSLDGGLYYNFKAPFTASLSAGYNINSGSGSSGPGTLFPVYYQMSLYYTLFKKQ